MAGAALVLTTLILVDADSTAECLKDSHEVSLYKNAIPLKEKKVFFFFFLIFWQWLIRYATEVSIHPVVLYNGSVRVYLHFIEQ